MKMYDIENIFKNTLPQIEDEIRSHMEDQPLNIQCANCGTELDIECSVTIDMALSIKVDPQTCGDQDGT